MSDEEKIISNLSILKNIKEEAGCKILLAQKAFSMFSLYPLIEKYLDGTTASGLYEARLGREEFKGEVHVFSPAFRDDEFDEIVSLCDHIVFNSPAEVFRFHERAKGKSLGLRVNPECSTQETAIYDPCAKGSRLGTTLENFDPAVLSYIDGLHFHTLCEQGADALDITLKAFEEKFGKYLKGLKWVNFGGGHHITRDDYDRKLLIGLVREFKERYGVEVYLEPGEAIALNAGYLVTKVLDVVHNDIDIALLDTSAACHMLLHCLFISLFDIVFACERRHEHQKRRLRKMKIRDKTVTDLKAIAGKDKDIGIAFAGRKMTLLIRRSFHGTERGGSDTYNPAASFLRGIDEFRGFP